MWVGPIQSIEDLRRKKTDLFQRGNSVSTLPSDLRCILAQSPAILIFFYLMKASKTVRLILLTR